MCLCASGAVAALWDSARGKKKSLALLGQGFRTGSCYQGAGPEAKAQAFFGPVLFLVQVLTLQTHASSADEKACVPPTAAPLLLMGLGG